VEVVDIDAKTLVGTIRTAPGVHGIALGARVGPRVHQQRRGVYRHNFRLKTLKKAWRSANGEEAGRDHFRSGDVTGLAFNGDSESGTVITARTAR